MVDAGIFGSILDSSVELGGSDKGRFLILSVKAGLGRQGGIVDKEDLIQKMVY
jgi:hypothetical protein